MAAYHNILVDKQDGIVTLTLNRPESLNAMTADMGDEISQFVQELKQDHAARVLIVTGAGRAFSAGGAKGNLQSRTTGGASRNTEPPKAFYQRFLSLRQLEIPTIAAINGHAVGAGFCIALACDMRVAAAEAKMGLNFVRLGIHPGMAGTYTTPRIVGLAKACEVIFTGKLYTGEEAFALGLVNRVVPTEKVLDEARLLARDIAANAPIAVRLAKKALYKGDADLLDAAIEVESEHQAYTWTTADAKEGISAMTEKRTPKFQGK
ncbi:MAG TPA: enoyl-CoA hydratase-related protein [Methylomirabilota bacterium]|jgi:enoyl-CoA hydratase|nr:enoyl-CoA hydratase-related protein [Methylomirabilota bacterium]